MSKRKLRLEVAISEILKIKLERLSRWESLDNPLLNQRVPKLKNMIDILASSLERLKRTSNVGMTLVMIKKSDEDLYDEIHKKMSSIKL